MKRTEYKYKSSLFLYPSVEVGGNMNELQTPEAGQKELPLKVERDLLRPRRAAAKRAAAKRAPALTCCPSRGGPPVTTAFNSSQ